MKASETQLQPILEGSKQYIIPLFQRPYSWTKKHWQTLWDDLLDLYDAGDNREHFLGAIVTMPIDMLPQGVAKLLLIDGQQRLTTLLILLAAIREAAASDSSAQLAEQLNEQYLINKWATGPNRFKLLPTQGDRNPFFAIINGSADGNSRLVQSQRFFAAKLRRSDRNGHPLDLAKLHNILVQQFVVVSIVLAKDENPYVIFESLNAKGQPLTQADLVRNYLFMRINDPDEEEIAYNDLWHPMEQDLGPEITNFLWRYLTKDGAFVRQSNIYEEIKNRLSILVTADEVVDVLVDMHTFATYYRRLIDPTHEPHPGIRRRLRRLNRWEIKTSYPFLLALYHDYARNYLSAEQFCAIIDSIESFVVRRFFARRPTNTLNRIFIGLYNSLDGSDVVTSTQSELLARDWPNDTKFLEGWRTFPIYQSGTGKTRHVLESLEEALTNNNEPVDLRHNRITIEHILPQTLNEQWEQDLGPQADQIHRNYLHTIGNLTLTGSNEPMGNAPFAIKRNVFAASNFALSKKLTECTSWGPSEIAARAQTLGHAALNIWQRPAIDEVRSSDDPTGHKPTSFTLFGEEHLVNTWREMLIQTAQLLAQLHGVEEFAARTAPVSGSRRQYIAYSADAMATPNQIPGTPLWIETNLSSRHILSIISQLMRACGHSETEFSAHW